MSAEQTPSSRPQPQDSAPHAPHAVCTCPQPVVPAPTQPVPPTTDAVPTPPAPQAPAPPAPAAQAAMGVPVASAPPAQPDAGAASVPATPPPAPQTPPAPAVTVATEVADPAALGAVTVPAATGVNLTPASPAVMDETMVVQAPDALPPVSAAAAVPADLGQPVAGAALGGLQDGQSTSRTIKNHIATGLMYSAFGIALIPLVWILWTVITKGARLLAYGSWWTNSQAGMTARFVGGGAYHAIIGTLMQGVITTLIAVPLGILTAIYLVEYGRGRFAKAVSFMVDILTGIPSIVAALFIYAVWVTTLGFQRIPIAVCLSLIILMIPIVVRSTEEMLKLVPNELREASYALGVPKWKTIVKIVLPTAFSGIVTGVLLGMARVMGETAPLIVLAPYTFNIQTNLFAGYQATLPTMINNNRVESLLPAVERMWAASLTLILLILVLNIAGRFISRYSAVKN